MRTWPWLMAVPMAVASAEEETDYALRLANPLSAIVTVSMASEMSFKRGPTDQESFERFSIEPVVPIPLGADWKLLSRTAIPIVSRRGLERHSGLGDLTQSFLLSPVQPGQEGTYWGLGPIFRLDTASDTAIGAGQWGAGIEADLVQQTGNQTSGVRAGFMWGRGGQDEIDVDSAFLTPFANYTRNGFTYGGGFELRWDSASGQMILPVHANLARLIKVGPFFGTVGGSLLYYVDVAENLGDWGFRVGITLGGAPVGQ